jgi:hypothetical protein
MFRYAPIILGAVAIVGLTIPQIMMSDRFAESNVSAQQRAQLLEKLPMRVGDWVGEELPVDEEVRKTAGAVGAVSRTYRHTRTGDQVNLWLIVGHARQISNHTPDICYRGSGFTTRAAENSLHPFAFEGQPQAPFWTNTFVKEDTTGRQLVRVFWSWYNPEEKDQEGVRWQAPKNARWYFGNTRALYKMYFTSVMRDPKETTDESSCVRFARDFMPVVDAALAEVNVPAPAGADAAGGGNAEGAEPAAAPSAEPAQS